MSVSKLSQISQGSNIFGMPMAQQPISRPLFSGGGFQPDALARDTFTSRFAAPKFGNTGTLDQSQVQQIEDTTFGFVPTPEGLVDEMMKQVDIRPGMTALEPSAGTGRIADKLRDKGVDVEVCEVHPLMQKHLESKGYPLVASDCLDYKPAQKKDIILMNPPFEDCKDMAHVFHAYHHQLAPGGSLVAIIPESSFNTTKANTPLQQMKLPYNIKFDEWLKNLDAKVIKLDKKWFITQNPGEERRAVSTRMVVIHKSQNDTSAPSENPFIPPVRPSLSVVA